MAIFFGHWFSIFTFPPWLNAYPLPLISWPLIAVTPPVIAFTAWNNVLRIDFFNSHPSKWISFSWTKAKMPEKEKHNGFIRFCNQNHHWSSSDRIEMNCNLYKPEAFHVQTFSMMMCPMKHQPKMLTLFRSMKWSTAMIFKFNRNVSEIDTYSKAYCP